MATIKYNVRQVKNGVRVEAKIRLPCGHTVTEYCTARTEENGRTAAKRFLDDAVKSHKEDCRK